MSFPSNHIWWRQFQTSWLDLFLGQYILNLTFISIFWSYKPNLLYFCKLQTWQCQVLTRYIAGLSGGRHDTRDETGEIGRNLCEIFLHLVVEALFRARLTQNPFCSCVTLLFFRNEKVYLFYILKQKMLMFFFTEQKYSILGIVINWYILKFSVSQDLSQVWRQVIRLFCPHQNQKWTWPAQYH